MNHFLINTLLQRGVKRGRGTPNRFNGFGSRMETAEAVKISLLHRHTPLKRCVNENSFQESLHA